jgi:hypothetical protein
LGQLGRAGKRKEGEEERRAGREGGKERVCPAGLYFYFSFKLIPKNILKPNEILQRKTSSSEFHQILKFKATHKCNTQI